MPRWAVSSSSRAWRATLTLTLFRPRHFGSVQRVNIPCASSGSISVDLHNVQEHDQSHPLIIWIPPFPQGPGLSHSNSNPATLLPSWLRHFPTAVINYRWAGFYPSDTPSQSDISDQTSPPAPLHWPTPSFDVLFGYSWIQQHLAPPDLSRRDIYIVSSYLGASLAAGLALSESHAHQPTAIRGLINFNGIYNWTTFLPDHPINKSKKTKANSLSLSEPSTPSEDQSLFPLLKHHVPSLFNTPEHLFDPFASACLFFHSAALFVPPNFNTPLQPSEMTQAIDALSSMTSPSTIDTSQSPKPPRKGYLAFPPRNSTLKVPPALLLHETTPPILVSFPGTTKGKGKPKSSTRFGGLYTGENSFQSQANELASLMRRSINLLELKERVKWDSGDDRFDGEDDGGWGDEAERRVQVGDVGRVDEAGLDAAFGAVCDGEDGGDFGLTELGQEMVGEWLGERI